jgi:hypothetical protein
MGQQRAAWEDRLSELAAYPAKSRALQCSCKVQQTKKGGWWVAGKGSIQVAPRRKEIAYAAPPFQALERLVFT